MTNSDDAKTRDEQHERRRLGATFNEGGERYHALRPGYPREVVDWMVGPAPRDVVEVGAGTGKLTAELVAAGHRVVAIEPAQDMLTQLVASLPGCAARIGTGEDTGLAAASADVVAYGQAWHWVDPEAGVAEAARVLRPGGVLALVWNFFDVDVDWVARFAQAMHGGESKPGQARSESADDVRAPFRRQSQRTFRWMHRMTSADLAALVTTRSYYLELDAPGRADLEQQVREVVAREHGGVDDRVVEVPHVTEAFRFVRS